MNIQKPRPGWRKGQTIFNFLEWLRIEKELDANQGDRLADTFHISDADFDKYWEEYLSKFED